MAGRSGPVVKAIAEKPRPSAAFTATAPSASARCPFPAAVGIRRTDPETPSAVRPGPAPAAASPVPGPRNVRSRADIAGPSVVAVKLSSSYQKGAPKSSSAISSSPSNAAAGPSPNAAPSRSPVEPSAADAMVAVPVVIGTSSTPTGEVAAPRSIRPWP